MIVALARRVGRPRLLASPQEFATLADEYFRLCIEHDEPFTITGLAIGVCLATRDGLDGYQARPEFHDIVKKAKILVENGYERRLHGQHVAGAIFSLKNMGWSDRQDVSLSGGLASIDFSRLSDEQLTRIAGGENILAVLSSTVLRALPAGSPQAEEGEG
jgi:hypothetical protein